MCTTNPIGNFNIGYVGVDIFLFLSGFGLAASFEKNELSRFYKNRFARIYPLYFIGVVATYIIMCHKVWGADDLLYNLSSLSFYIEGGTQRYDWYLESLFMLYLLFPLFYYFSKLKYVALSLLFVATVIVLYVFDVPWWYDCLIARLPIFLYGIMFAKCHKSAKYIGLLGLILYIPCRLYVSQFLATSLLVIAIIYLSSYFMGRLKPTVKNAIDFVGKHSLEIYIANLFICWSIQIYTLNMTEKVALYIIVQVVGAYAIIKANKYITRWL